MNDLAALLGGGAAPAAPLPSSPPAGPDPLAGALMGGGPAPADPMAAMMGGAMGGAPMPPQFPSTDPNAVNQIVGQLVMMQQGDQAQLQQEQMATLAADPLLQSLLAGAPLGPGAGQDAQAIGVMGDIAPDPSLPA